MAAAATVFVSYKRGHAPSESVLNDLEPALRQAGFKVLCDRDIIAGELWPDELWRWLMECSGAIILASEEAMVSDWCRREWAVLAARQSLSDLRVVPVLLDGAESRVDVFDRVQEVAAGPEAVGRVVSALAGLREAPMRPADYLAAHIAWLEWQCSSAPVLGREPFSLADVYVETDCGVMLWGDISGDERIDPFDEHAGGRSPLVDAALEQFADPDFRDLVVVQGPAGSGKSAFTLRLASRLAADGLAPIVVRFRDLRLSTYGTVDELLADAVRVAPIGEHPPVPKGPLFDRSSLSEPVRLGAAEIARVVFIIDGWDEVTLTGSKSYREQLATWLPRLREYLTERPGPPVRLLLTGRPSTEVNTSGVLRRVTPVLTIRPLHPAHLRTYASKISARLDGADWTLDLERCEEGFASYEAWFDGRSQGGAEVLGSPLLALLAFRTMATWTEEPARLFERSSALYHALIEITVANAGKADKGPEGTVHRGGSSLRRLLQRVASIITTQGTEAISFRELELRLEEDEALLKWAAEATANDTLHELVVNFYFKGHPELGCEFLHKSFREYLHAEAVIAALEAVSDGQSGAFAPPALNFWDDFPPDTPHHTASRSLAALLAPQWLTSEVRSHLVWLVQQEAAADPSRWLWIRDLLADIYKWWAAGAHLRMSPSRRRGRTEWNPPLVVEMLADFAPRDDRHTTRSPRTATLDARLGDALLQLTAVVHAEVTASDMAGSRQHQVLLDGRVGFQAGNEPRPGFARDFVSRIDAPGQRPIGPDLTGAFLPSIVLDKQPLHHCVFASCTLTGAHLSRADLTGAVFASADLTGARMDRATLYRADLSYARLVGAVLKEADLRLADLNGADLRNADLTAADLRRANLDGAILDGANLDGAVIED